MHSSSPQQHAHAKPQLGALSFYFATGIMKEYCKKKQKHAIQKVNIAKMLTRKRWHHPLAATMNKNEKLATRYPLLISETKSQDVVISIPAYFMSLFPIPSTVSTLVRARTTNQGLPTGWNKW
ncbi:hypothetical protein H5410_037488 [Solanum commersonii]|uniref:Uncharacterized protein n=1 Tax=Solanum commersonii TaxID=4109 RepID=A0A9J5Y9N7_SOLCO|nr:hypothetical protein H5410_037488 [Solanum commersonii]